MSGNEKTKTCSRCGAVFSCGSDTPRCWCQDLPPVKIESADDCLCPACLATLAKSQTASQDAAENV